MHVRHLLTNAVLPSSSDVVGAPIQTSGMAEAICDIGLALLAFLLILLTRLDLNRLGSEVQYYTRPCVCMHTTPGVLTYRVGALGM